MLYLYVDMKRTPFLHIVVLFVFFIDTIGLSPLAQAQYLRMPPVGVRVALSPPFNPSVLRGLIVHPENPFFFDFILQRGDASVIPAKEQLKAESTRLIKYFLASLTTPEEELWVNLSPYEKQRIVPSDFGQTAMGRDLLAQDYLLKQITASLMHPDDLLGKKFWQNIYRQAAKRYGTTQIPVETFNKVWIMPKEASLFEKGKTVFIAKATLKVMLESDYLSMKKHDRAMNDGSGWQKQIVKELIIPALEKEVNEGKNFATLRQVYYSLILATWFKKHLKDSLLSRAYVNQRKVHGIRLEDDLSGQDPQLILRTGQIYRQYLRAFKKGVVNMIREDKDPITGQMIPRKYFSGGMQLSFNVGQGASQAMIVEQVHSLSKSIKQLMGLLPISLVLVTCFLSGTSQAQLMVKASPQVTESVPLSAVFPMESLAYKRIYQLTGKSSFIITSRKPKMTAEDILSFYLGDKVKDLNDSQWQYLVDLWQVNSNPIVVDFTSAPSQFGDIANVCDLIKEKGVDQIEQRVELFKNFFSYGVNPVRTNTDEFITFNKEVDLWGVDIFKEILKYPFVSIFGHPQPEMVRLALKFLKEQRIRHNVPYAFTEQQFVSMESTPEDLISHLEAAGFSFPEDGSALKKLNDFLHDKTAYKVFKKKGIRAKRLIEQYEDGETINFEELNRVLIEDNIEDVVPSRFNNKESILQLRLTLLAILAIYSQSNWSWEHYSQMLGSILSSRFTLDDNAEADKQSILIGQNLWLQSLGSSVAAHELGHLAFAIAGYKEDVFKNPIVWEFSADRGLYWVDSAVHGEGYVGQFRKQFKALENRHMRQEGYLDKNGRVKPEVMDQHFFARLEESEMRRGYRFKMDDAIMGRALSDLSHRAEEGKLPKAVLDDLTLDDKNSMPIVNFIAFLTKLYVAELKGIDPMTVRFDANDLKGQKIWWFALDTTHGNKPKMESQIGYTSDLKAFMDHNNAVIILPSSAIHALLNKYQKELQPSSQSSKSAPGGIDLSLKLDDIDVMSDEEDQMPLFDLQDANISGLQVQIVDIQPFQNIAFDN